MRHTLARGAGGPDRYEHRAPAKLPTARSAHEQASAFLPAPRRSKPRRRLPPEVLTDAEVRALLAACPGTLPGIRNRALLTLLYRGGLRIGEALALRPKDIDLEQGTVRVLFGKGGYSRVIGIDPGCAAVLREWVQARQRWGHLPVLAPLFCSSSGKKVTQGYIRRLLPELGRRAGLEKRVHAHGFRHTHAAQLREEGLDIGIISKQLGHRSITTTARYLDHIAPLAVIDAMRRRAWAS